MLEVILTTRILKYNETSSVIPKTGEKELVVGNLEQCQKICDDDEDCIGFVREEMMMPLKNVNYKKCYKLS